MAVAFWGTGVILLALFYGAPQIPTCLALDDAVNAACRAAWYAGQPPPPPDIINTTTPWPWLAMFLAGTLVILAIAAVIARRRPNGS